MSATVRIDKGSYSALRELARVEGLSLAQALRRAVEAYRRQVFLAGVSEDFAALRADSRSWAEETAEREAWDAIAADGLASE